jgi:NAD(P)-dependent dehydrogenase (short-subunit alcohol dehydrogenase family)
MAGRLEGKAALITGAGSGIGRATALAFVREGARVLAADVSADAGEETVGLIRAQGGDAAFMRADVSNPDDVQRLIRAAVNRFGRLDCAFNNAGIEGAVAPMHEYPDDAYHRVIAVNLTGVWLCMKAEIAQMLAQGGGAIVNTASGAGLRGSFRLSAYSATKHAVVGLTRSAALEYATSGIRVNVVCPGPVRTPMIERIMQDPELLARMPLLSPAGRAAEPEEIAEAVVWL